MSDRRSTIVWFPICGPGSRCAERIW
jgi:hypothetical protein